MGRWILCIAQCMGYIYKYVNAFSEQTYPIHSCRRSARTSCSGRGTSQSYRHKIRINYHARNRHNPHNSPGATTHPYIRGLKQHLYSCAGHLYRTSPPDDWKTDDQTSTHQATWILYTKGAASILVNEETHGNSLCTFTQDTGLPSEATQLSEDIEDLDAAVAVITISGEKMKIAVQLDNPDVAHACEQGKAPDVHNFGILTSIGHVMLQNPDHDPAIMHDFIELVKSFNIANN